MKAKMGEDNWKCVVVQFLHYSINYIWYYLKVEWDTLKSILHSLEQLVIIKARNS